MLSLRTTGSLIRRAVQRFDEGGAMRQGAALAFYATLSLAPLLLLTVSAVSFLPHNGETDRIVRQVALLVGDEGAEVARAILDDAPGREQGLLGVAGGFVLLLFGGSALFVNVKGTLNELWNVRAPDRGVVRGFLRTRFVAVLMMLTTGGVLLFSMVLGAAANWVAPLVERQLPVGATVVTLLELGVSGAVLTLLCAATYRILPDVDIAWRDVWFGALLTAALFLAGRTLIGWYLARAASVSRFGAAGSLFVFLMWVYYSAQIFLFGAEFTQVRAEERGAPIEPSPGARQVEVTVREVEP